MIKRRYTQELSLTDPSPNQENTSQTSYNKSSILFVHQDHDISKQWNWNNYMQKTLKNITKQRKYSENTMSRSQSFEKLQSLDDNMQLCKSQIIMSQVDRFSSTLSLPSYDLSKIKTSFRLTQNKLIPKINSQIRIQKNFQSKISNGILKLSQIMFFTTHYKIKQISVIKILPSAIDQTQFYSIKFNYQNQSIHFGTPLQRYYDKINYHFGWFMGIIINRMTPSNITQKPVFKQEDIVRVSGSYEYKYSGSIFKKSQYLGRWCQRWLILNQKGLFFYNLQKNTQKHSFFIAGQNIKYIQTQFQIYNKCLVFIIKHGIRKTQLAFPIYELLNSSFSWLLQIYNLMMVKKNQ